MHPNAQVVMRGFQAFAEGDMATMKELFSDDLKWHTGGTHKYAGTHEGTDAVLRLMQDVSSEAKIDNRPHDILASDDHVVVLVNSHLEKDGKTADMQNVFVFHVSDGKVTEAWGIPADAAAADAFWA